MTARNILEVSLVRSPSFWQLAILASASDISTPESESVSDKLKADCALGQIDFINCLPITWVLQREKPERLSLAFGTPGALNTLYREKKLDLGAMSSHYFLEDGGFELFGDISISSRGPVGSVLFFSRRPLSEYKNSAPLKIGVPRASASSVRLVHILLAETYGLEPRFVALDEPDPTAAPSNIGAEMDAYLCFGDSALRVDKKMSEIGQNCPSGRDFTRLDLGQWWFERYNLPMVFGVWAARKSWIEANPQDFAALSGFLAACPALGLNRDFAAVVAEASERTGLSAERLERYYRHELDFGLSTEHREGLALYQELCKKHGLLIK